MTALPILPERWRMPMSAAAVLLLVMVAGSLK